MTTPKVNIASLALSHIALQSGDINAYAAAEVKGLIVEQLADYSEDIALHTKVNDAIFDVVCRLLDGELLSPADLGLLLGAAYESESKQRSPSEAIAVFHKKAEVLIFGGWKNDS